MGFKQGQAVYLPGPGIWFLDKFWLERWEQIDPASVNALLKEKYGL